MGVILESEAVLDTVSGMVCLESPEDLYIDLHIAANPDAYSSDALEDDPVVYNTIGSDADRMAGIESEEDIIDVPEEEPLPTLYELRDRSDPDYEVDVPFNALPAQPIIADEDLPEDSPYYGYDDDDGIFDNDEDAEVTAEEIEIAENLDDLLEMAWERKTRHAIAESLDDYKSKPTTMDASKGGKTNPNPLAHEGDD